ncbi:beta-galactosidase GalA [Desertivirga xinjiangensis]|uniref:beta-galactosidase GalA n=1 Tax=Desertivirga xinjiangensis TaxID=539206 RepID=UPI00210A429A|nr:beta-galactosidase GalA [Pedobacter xinjiangensis]
MIKLIQFAILIAFVSADVCQLRAQTSVKHGAADITAGDNGIYSLNEGWFFHKGDIPFPVINGHSASYFASKAGNALGAAAIDFDATDWQTLNVPHDWAMENPVDSTANIAQGYRKRGISWYRRHFQLDSADKGKHLELQFDGIATHATIWVNGQLMHRSWSAYTSSYIDISAVARYGDDLNTIAIRVDADAMEGWWYEGAGIYAHTWLLKQSPLHIVTDGIYANPVKASGPKNEWKIPVEISLRNDGRAIAQPDIEVILVDPGNNTLASANLRGSVEALEAKTFSLTLSVSGPRLWEPESPVLYKVLTRIKENGKIMDQRITKCGFRTIRFSADSGFFLNDKHVLIKGVCNHTDHAGVGVAVPDGIWDFRMERIKELGANAYRCTHAAPPKRILELCDSLGILVMDENRNFNSSPDYMNQLEWMVKRDRNHPSVILWSVFNEEPMQGTLTGYEMVRRMAARVKALDNTRPVTAAMNGGFFEADNVSKGVDVTGFNYEIKHYDRFHKENPEMPVMSSEDASAVMIRGEYVTDHKKHLLDSYDTQAPKWGATHRTAWKAIAERPWMAGGFVWTGFDYLGEPTPFTWPTVNSSFGAMDICGFPKTGFYIRQAFWKTDEPVLHIAPHWNWPGDSTGKPIKVLLVSNADKVQLKLNGKLIGEKVNDPYEMTEWIVPYSPGKLEAIGFSKGKQVSQTSVQTTGKPVRLNLIPYRGSLKNDGNDAMPVTVEAFDDKGRHVPDANLPVTFRIQGSGNIIGLGNGNPNSHEPEKGNKQSLFNGLAQVIIQSQKGGGKNIVLEATAPGLKPASLKIPILAVKPIAAIPAVRQKLLLSKWKLSPATAEKPDPNATLADNDMNSWQAITAGNLTKMKDGKYAVLRTTFSPLKSQQASGGKIILKDVRAAKAEFYLNGKKVFEKNPDRKGAASEDIVIPFEKGLTTLTLSVLFQSQEEELFGLGAIPVIE